MTRDRTLYISLLMPPDLETKPTEPGLWSLHDTMLSMVPAVSPILKAPAYSTQTKPAHSFVWSKAAFMMLVIVADLGQHCKESKAKQWLKRVSNSEKISLREDPVMSSISA